MTAIVLVRTQHEGNLGAVARAMANFGLEQLILVDPEVAIGEVARARAVGAGHVLDQAVEVTGLEAAIGPFHRVVATTSERGRTAGIDTFTPRALAHRLGQEPASSQVAVVFGPEASGLTGQELALCGWHLNIPCSPRQPTLNLSHALAVVAYELQHSQLEAAQQGDLPPEHAAASAEQVAGLLDQVESVLRQVEFARDDTFAGVLRDLQRMAARVGLSAREVSLLRGMCRRTLGTLRAGDASGSDDAR